MWPDVATPCIMHLMCNFHLKVKILPGDPRIAGPALPSPSAHNGLDCLFSQICENILDLTHNITLFSDSLQVAADDIALEFQ